MKKKDHINGLVVIPLLMVALAFQVSAEPESSGSIENKEVLTFKLMRGTQYPMCHEYVAMLNKTGYTEPPICDRIILPEFKKFKAVPWVKIENKDEIKSVTKNMIKMESLSPLNRKYTFDMQWAMAKKNMDLGVYPIISRAKIDVDYDGQDENAYKFSSIHPNLSKYNACITLEKYFFDYGEKTKSIYGDSSNSPSVALRNPGEWRLFYYDGRIYQDYWLGLNAQYHLKLNEISGIPDQVCAVNVINKGEGK